MPDIIEATFPIANSAADQRRERALADSQRATFAQGFGAVLDEQFASTIGFAWGAAGIPNDPAYKLDQKKLDELADGVHPSLRPMFARAGSSEEAQVIRLRALELTENMNTLGSMGFTGTALQIGASIADPITLGVGLATGGFGSAAVTGGRLARIGALIRSGVVAGVPFAGLEAFKSSQDPRITGVDIARSAASGFGFGVAGTLSKSAGRAVRFVAGGAGGAAGEVSVDLAAAALGEDLNSNDILYGVAQSFVLNGVMNALHSTRSGAGKQLDAKMAQAGRNITKRIEAEDLSSVGASVTPKGEAYLRAVTPDDTAAVIHNSPEFQEVREALGIDPAFSRDRAQLENTKTELEEILRTRPAINPARPGFEFPAKKFRSGPITKINEGTASPTLGSDLLKDLLGPDGTPEPAPARETTIFDEKPELLLMMSRREYQQATAPKPPAINDLVIKLPDPEPRGERVLEELASLVRRGKATVTVDQPTHHKIGFTFDPAKKTLTYTEPAPTAPRTVAEAIAKDKDAKAAASVQESSVGAATENEIKLITARREAFEKRQAKKRFGDLDLSIANSAAPSLAKVGPIPLRFDMPGLAGQSEVPSIVKASNMLGADPLPKADGSPSLFTAPEWQTATHDDIVARYFTREDAVRAAYIKAANEAGAEVMPLNQWREEVTKAKRRPRGEYTNDPHINEMADFMRAHTDEVFDIARRHGVKGTQNVQAGDTYVTRIGNRPKIDELSADPEIQAEDGIRRLMGEAILKGSEDLTPEQADFMGQAWIKNISIGHEGGDVQRARMFTSDDAEVMAQSLRDTFGDKISETTIEQLVYLNTPRKGESGKIARLKRRIGMDETHSITLKSGRKISVEDLLENNSAVVMQKYSREMTGAAALTEALENLKLEPGENLSTIPQLEERLYRDAEAMGYKRDQVRADVNIVVTMAKQTAGYPLSENTQAVRAFRMLREMQFIRVMSGISSGIQNFGEIAEAISETGARALLKQAPAVGEMFARGRDGQLTNRHFRELERFGLGVDRINRRVLPRTGVDEGTQVSMGKAEELVAKGQRFAADVSGQSIGTSVMQKSVGGAILDWWGDAADRGQLASEKRLAGMGLKPEMAQRILDQLKEHKTLVEGPGGGKYTATNFENWTDVEAATNFRNAVVKQTNRLILRNNPTAYAKWMTTEWGKVIAQLRTYAFGAWTNKLLYNVKMADAQALVSLGISSVAAAGTYMLRTYLDSIGNPDRENFLANRLAPDKVLMAGFSRAAYSSLIPTAVDTVWHDMMGREAMFSYARGSGIEGGALLGNPTVQWAGKAVRIPSAVFGPALSDYDFSKGDVNTLKTGLFIPRIYGVENALSQLVDRLGLPEQSTTNSR